MEKNMETTLQGFGFWLLVARPATRRPSKNVKIPKSLGTKTLLKGK